MNSFSKTSKEDNMAEAKMGRPSKVGEQGRPLNFRVDLRTYAALQGLANHWNCNTSDAARRAIVLAANAQLGADAEELGVGLGPKTHQVGRGQVKLDRIIHDAGIDWAVEYRRSKAEVDENLAAQFALYRGLGFRPIVMQTIHIECKRKNYDRMREVAGRMVLSKHPQLGYMLRRLNVGSRSLDNATDPEGWWLRAINDAADYIGEFDDNVEILAVEIQI
jgi:hypothetical protein